MFKDYEILEYLGYNHITCERKYKIKIIDDDFEIVVGAVARDGRYLGAATIINVYSIKQLPVAENLVLLILKLNEKKYPYWEIKEIIKFLEKYIPVFKQYKEEIEKILLFK